MQLILTNTTTNYSIYSPNITPITENEIYWEFEIDTSRLIDGEYQLKLYSDNNQIIYTDLVKIGLYKPTKISYQVNKKYKTYNGK